MRFSFPVLLHAEFLAGTWVLAIEKNLIVVAFLLLQSAKAMELESKMVKIQFACDTASYEPSVG